MFDPTVDRPDLLTGIVQFVLGSIFFPLIFYGITSILKKTPLGQFVCHQFNIKNHGVLDIGNKITSSIFALLACVTGTIVIKQCNSNELYERYYVLDNYLIFGFPYFFYDIVSMYMVHSTENKEKVTVSPGEILSFLSIKPMIILHHILVPLVGFPTLMYFRGGTGDCLLGTSFLIEASTPFVSLRVILVHLQLKETKIYLLNGLLMLFTFFICRVMLFPYLYCCYASALGVSLLSTLASLPFWVHCIVIGLWAPQLIWFHRMLRGSLKLIREIRKSPSIPQEGTQHPQWEDMVENKGRNGEEGQQLQGKEERNTGDQEEDIKDNKNQEEYKVNVENQKENELNFKKIDRISEEQIMEKKDN